MANEIPNAVSLMQSSPFRDWIRAAIVYKARDVITEALQRMRAGHFAQLVGRGRADRTIDQHRVP